MMENRYNSLFQELDERRIDWQENTRIAPTPHGAAMDGRNTNYFTEHYEKVFASLDKVIDTARNGFYAFPEDGYFKDQVGIYLGIKIGDLLGVFGSGILVQPWRLHQGVLTLSEFRGIMSCTAELQALYGKLDLISRYYRALAYYDHNMVDEAISEMEEALLNFKLESPRDSRASNAQDIWDFKMRVHLKRQELHRALHCATQVILCIEARSFNGKCGAFDSAYRNRAEIYDMLGDRNAAYQDRERAKYYGDMTIENCPD